MKKSAQKSITYSDEPFQLEPLINSLVWGLSVLELVSNEDTHDADKMAWCLKQIRSDARILQENYQKMIHGISGRKI